MVSDMDSLVVTTSANLTIDRTLLAIIQADANRYGGTNKCLLWKAFAKRGLGSGKLWPLD